MEMLWWASKVQGERSALTYSKPVALWAVPRSVSTALERVFVERGDFKVFHEPFSASYYYSPERRSDRFAGMEAKEEYGHQKILERMLEIEEQPVYFKDMAYHVAGFMSREFISRFTNTFIIREPAPVIASLNRFWPDFTLEETGYEQQSRLFGLAVENGEDPAVVDAADLTANPEGTIHTYCEKMGIEFMPEALSWEPGEVPGWEMWTQWHEEAQESTGIKSQPLEDDTEVPAGLESVYEHCLPYYEELHERRLRPPDKN
jgi:Sulfotransferase domain